MASISFVAFCPRCDRPVEKATRIDTWDALKEHVRLGHPDYDPNWWDTAPHSPDTTVTPVTAN